MESSIGILLKGYPMFLEKFRKQQTDVIETTLLLQKTYVIKGKEAAKLFYDQNLFIRKKATPKRFQKTLFGEGGVQGLDGDQHRHRKALFMQYMNAESLDKIESIFTRHWMQALNGWETKNKIVLFDEAEKILMQTACEWTGVPLPEETIDLHTNQMSDMIDASGGVGWRHYKGRIARTKAEKWIEQLIDEIRSGKTTVSKNSILYGFTFHKTLKNKLLPSRIAAVEIINLLRPIVAIARYIVFGAHALHENPDYVTRLQSNKKMIHWFVQEVRRHYPFFPFIAAKTVKTFTWNDVQFKSNKKVLLDLYATNHDESLWNEPGRFYPERFANHKENPYDLIPQGGGDFNNNHRCAGEWITIRLIEKSLCLLVSRMAYRVPPQDLSIALNRIPATPRSRFKMTDVKERILK